MKCHVIYGVWRLALIVCEGALLKAADEASGAGDAPLDCTIDECENGGTCIENNNEFFCSCSIGWSGTRCEIDLDECSDYNYNCDTHFTCANTPGSYTCVTTTTTTSILALQLSDSQATDDCSEFTDLMNDATMISDNDITIQYQEARTDAGDLFDDVKKRQIPSVAIETFTIDFPEAPEFWIESLYIVVEEDVKVDVILMTSQLCTNQSTNSKADVSRNASMSKDFYASAYFQNFDLSTFTGQGSMECISQLIIKTKRSNVVADDSTFEVETKIKGCTLWAGELIADCRAHDLFTDLPVFSTYVQWKPTSAAKQTLRPDGDGLVLHHYMYPSITINFPMIVQSVTLIGNIFSATVIAANNSYHDYNEHGYPYLNIDFYPNRHVTTSTLKVTTLVPEATSNPDGEFVMQMEVMGCPTTAQSSTTTAPTDVIETTIELTTDTVETTDETTTTPPPQIHISTPAPPSPSSDYAQTTDKTTTPSPPPRIHISSPAPPSPSSDNAQTTDKTTTTPLPPQILISSPAPPSPSSDNAQTTDKTTTTPPPPQIHISSPASPSPSSDYAQTTDETTSTQTPPASSSTPKSSESTAINTSTKPTSLSTQRPPKVSRPVVTSAPATSETPATDTCCMVTCTGPILSKVEMDQKLVELEKNLTIPKHLTAKSKRKKISADDGRPSATAVGSCCGIVVLTLAGSFIVVMDIDHVIRAYYFLKVMLGKRVKGF